MKAFLLCAGQSTRLRPLTDKLPKCLIPIRGTPMLAIWLQICHQAGIDEVLVNTHWQAESVRDFFQRFHPPVRVKITFEPKLLGSAGTVRANRDWVENEERFWVIYSDVLTTTDLRKMEAFARAQNGILTMGLHPVDNPRDSGIAALSPEGRITAFEEKPLHSTGDLAFAGMLLAGRRLLSELPEAPQLDFGHDVFPRLKNHMAGYVIRDYLVDIGTMARLSQAQESWPGLQDFSPPGAG